VRRGRLLLLLAVAVVAGGTAVMLGVAPVDRPAFIDRLEYPLDYGDLVRTHAARNRLDAALVAAVIYQESRFRPHVVSKMGAMGLMQIQPSTAETIARRTGGTAGKGSQRQTCVAIPRASRGRRRSTVTRTAANCHRRRSRAGRCAAPVRR
jgi:soluble lytic murein transglycosylase-like protein